jgi:ribosome-associated translation inhibitor RaiA
VHVYLTARHMSFSDVLREYVERHLVEPIRNHNSLEIVRMEVQLFREGDKGPFYGCHVLVDVEGKHELNVREIDETLFEAIDLAQARVIRALTDLHHEILTGRRHPRSGRQLLP